MSDSNQIECGDHGVRIATYVCQHLVRGSGLGFYTSDFSDDDSDDQCAWCRECEKVRRQQGGWNDISEKFAGVTVICDLCFESARMRNL